MDWTYLAGLSDDALPVLRDLPDDLEECAIDLRRNDDDWLEWNLGRALAADFTEDHADDWVHRTDCPGQS